MKVLFLNYEFPPIGGGGANATYYLFKEFASYPEVEIDLVTSAWQDPGVSVFSSNIRIHKLDVSKKRLHYWTHGEVLSYIRRAYFYARPLADKADFCHAFFGFPSGMVAYWLKKKLPYLISLRGSDVPGFNNRFSLEYVFLTPVFKKIWQCAEGVLANSDGLRELALETAPRQEIDIIYNGIDTEEFKPLPTPKDKTGRLELIVVSRLIERKGIDYLLRALPLILEKRQGLYLTVIGEGNLDGELKALAKNLGISGRVSFLGFQEHHRMPEYYNKAHIFVLPSKNEGMSNTVLEAMSCGLPIITTDTGGTRELVRENGVVVPMEDEKALAGAVLEAAADPARLEEMGKVSRRTALRFSWRAQAEKYLELYKKLARGG